jgi:hypothetical protein
MFNFNKKEMNMITRKVLLISVLVSGMGAFILTFTSAQLQTEVKNWK